MGGASFLGTYISSIPLPDKEIEHSSRNSTNKGNMGLIVCPGDEIIYQLIRFYLGHVCFASFFNPLGTDLTNSYIPGCKGTFCFHLKNPTSLK